MGYLQACVFFVGLIAAVGCNREHKDCKILPCPSPGFDIETCTCFPGMLLGASGAGAADAYQCGTTACDANMQTCEHVVGGAPPGVDTYSCLAIPAACTNDVSCACLKTALLARGADQCDGDGRHLTVRIDVP